jgi:hypothetical protein
MARKTKPKSTKKPARTRTRKAAKAKPGTARAAARKAAKKTSAPPERLRIRQKKQLLKSKGRSKSIPSTGGYEEKLGQSVATRNYEASGQWNDDWTTEPKTASRTDKEAQEG